MPGPGNMKKSSKKKAVATPTAAPNPASAHALPPAASIPSSKSPPQLPCAITAADLLAILRYANATSHTGSTLASSTIGTPAASEAVVCATLENPAATDALIDDNETVTLINCTREIIGKETMQKILQYAFWKGRDQGYKLGYDEGYHEAAGCGIDDANDGWEAGYAEGHEFGLEEGRNLGIRAGYEEGVKDGEEQGRTAEREKQETKRERAEVDEGMQTEPLDEPTATPSPPPSPATSPLSTAAQPPSTSSTLSTTATTTSRLVFQCEPPPPAFRKRPHILPSQPTGLQQALQPPVSRPEPITATATSQPSTATKIVATTPKTMPTASSNTQTPTYTSGAAHQAVNDAPAPSTAQETPLCEVVRTRSSERVVHSTERFGQPPLRQRRSRSLPKPPSPPLLAPQAPVTPNEPAMTLHASTRSATSSTRVSTTTLFPLALTRSAPSSTALERRNKLGDPPGQPRNAAQPPGMPHTPRERAVSQPPASYIPAVSPTTPSEPRSTPPSPSKPPSTPVHPSSPQLHPKQAVLTPLTRFDWAEDAESLPVPQPAAPTPPRDFSALRTDRLQPFGTLRRRTRRRRAPPQFFLSSRKSFPPALLSFVQPQAFITRCHPSGIGLGKPVVTVPLGVAPAPAPSVPKLDWDQDPRLADLSRALRALGWASPC